MSERSFAQVEVPQGILDRFKKVATANVWDILLGHSGVYFSFIENVRLRTPGERLAARARTLRRLAVVTMWIAVALIVAYVGIVAMRYIGFPAF